MKRLVILTLAGLLLLPGFAFAAQTGKIGVATKDKSPESAVSDKAALAPYLLIFDERGDFLEALDNPFKKKTLEAGKLLADFLPEKGVTAVIGTDYCGDIIGVLKKKGVTAYNVEGSAAEAAVKVAQGKVRAALQEDALVANHKVMMERYAPGRRK